ncbi:hypothetical protein [Halarchaeum nitratireducens]|uniref:Uncharacterized protein n=1 Tax=Halarchaeum nitratireducens TaxID=489913 RepID=A0A830G836_9EURY|nr:MULTISPECIES: hypothetical protein [Halarchaeum]MBP2251398.1 hypothetical protein [Halarchaeum solikamskense]GGN07559.1 hypothetical protein GCM10009021_03430 [Halarchaeum nitratireducens]
MSSDGAGGTDGAENATGGGADGPGPAARAVRDAALAALDDAPRCVVCPAGADFYLYEAGRVSTFVCWEHVSPYAADVNGTPTDAERPIAVPLPSFTG